MPPLSYCSPPCLRKTASEDWGPLRVVSEETWKLQQERANRLPVPFYTLQPSIKATRDHKTEGGNFCPFSLPVAAQPYVSSSVPEGLLNLQEWLGGGGLHRGCSTKKWRPHLLICCFQWVESSPVCHPGPLMQSGAKQDPAVLHNDQFTKHSISMNLQRCCR